MSPLTIELITVLFTAIYYISIYLIINIVVFAAIALTYTIIRDKIVIKKREKTIEENKKCQ